MYLWNWHTETGTPDTKRALDDLIKEACSHVISLPQYEDDFKGLKGKSTPMPTNPNQNHAERAIKLFFSSAFNVNCGVRQGCL